MGCGIMWLRIAYDRLVRVCAVLRVTHVDEVLLGHYAVDLVKCPCVVMGFGYGVGYGKLWTRTIACS